MAVSADPHFLFRLLLALGFLVLLLLNAPLEAVLALGVLALVILYLYQVFGVKL